jgi:hypothetical protein
MRCSMRFWTLTGPTFEKHGCGLDLTWPPIGVAHARSNPPPQFLVQDEENGILILQKH